MVHSFDNEPTDEEMAIENAHQRPPLKTDFGLTEPEKVGELFAALYVLLVSKVLRTVKKRKELKKHYNVKGLFIDKMCGIVRCNLEVDIQEGHNQLKFHVTDCLRGVLNSDILCYHLHQILL